MNGLAEKVRALLPSLEKQGVVYLFGLFERDDASDKWDIVVSSDQGDRSRLELVREISSQLVPNLSAQELQAASRIAVIPSSEPGVSALTQSISVAEGQVEVQDCNFMGLHVKHAYIFRAKSPSPATEPQVVAASRSG